MRSERKRKLVVLLIGFFIALGFTILAIQKMMELVSIKQDLSLLAFPSGASAVIL